MGARAYRVLFAALSLPLATVAVVYFINHRYDGVPLWNVRGLPGVHEAVWVANFVSFYFLYPSTFNLLEARHGGLLASWPQLCAGCKRERSSELAVADGSLSCIHVVAMQLAASHVSRCCSSVSLLRCNVVLALGAPQPVKYQQGVDCQVIMFCHC